jgi:ribosomal protein S18 acetylase RimI-like enzyme
MVEIRRIHAHEAELVTELWDRMGREVPDGGPLTERGRRNIEAMLRAAAADFQVFCLVAVDAGQIVGFVVGEFSRGPLLPGTAGDLQELYVVPAARHLGASRRLAEAAAARFHEHGASPVWTHVCADNQEAQRFWTGLGFEGDAVRFVLYPATRLDRRATGNG